MSTTKNIAIILAAGKSLRMQGVDKIETLVNNKPLITYTIAPFLESKIVDKIVIACNNENITTLKKIFPSKQYKNIHFAIGGESRFQSAKNAFTFANKKFKPSETSTILFHNCGNVLATKQEIEDTIRSAKKHGACIVARPASDTLKKISSKNKITETVDRKEILYAETPQTFRLDILKKAYVQPIETTDESSLVEQSGHSIQWIQASIFNRKITTQHDIATTKMLLEKKTGITRMGIATDSHIYEKSSRKNLKLCGIEIKGTPKLSADSDGDVALHAIIAAISQAMGGGSLGTFATAMCQKGIINSKKYLEKMQKELKKINGTVTHVGLHFECHKPKIDTLAPMLKASLSKLLNISSREIGITASSGEGRASSKNGIHVTACISIIEGEVSHE